MKNKVNLKSILGAGLVGLLLICAVLVNMKLNSNAQSAALGSGRNAVDEAAPGETLAPVAGPQTQTGNYFDAFRDERTAMRDLEAQYLDEIIATSASNSETLEEAQQQKLALVENMEREFLIESQIKGKGFKDSAVTFSASSVSVIIDADTLTSEQAAQILDVVKRETGMNANNITISANAQ